VQITSTKSKLSRPAFVADFLSHLQYLVVRLGRFWLIPLTLAIAFLVINTDRPERFTYDNYVYMLKGLQISEGDWVPVRYAAIGWSAVLGFLYWVFSIDGIRQAETVSSITSGFFVALTVPVVILLLRDFLTNIRLICGMLLWITFCLVYFPPAGLTEPLYTLLGLGGTCLFITALKRSGNSLWL
jgi:hypothetical protein